MALPPLRYRLPTRTLGRRVTLQSTATLATVALGIAEIAKDRGSAVSIAGVALVLALLALSWLAWGRVNGIEVTVQGSLLRWHAPLRARTVPLGTVRCIGPRGSRIQRILVEGRVPLTVSADDGFADFVDELVAVAPSIRVGEDWAEMRGLAVKRS
jgi:hypothetical protein